jgi:hypothetical protein
MYPIVFLSVDGSQCHLKYLRVPPRKTKKQTNKYFVPFLIHEKKRGHQKPFMLRVALLLGLSGHYSKEDESITHHPILFL